MALILAIHGAKNIPPWYILFVFLQPDSLLKILNVAFLTKWP